MATIPCSVIKYVHYSRAIEEKKYSVGAKCTTHLPTAYLIISIFLHDTCTLMLDVSHVGKRMNKAHVKKRVEEHRFPTIEKEQGTSRWSICKEPCVFSPVFCRLPTYKQIKEHELFANH